MANYINSYGLPRGYVEGLKIGKFIIRDVVLTFQIIEIYPYAKRYTFLDTDKIDTNTEFGIYHANKLSFSMECINEWMKKFKK